MVAPLTMLIRNVTSRYTRRKGRFWFGAAGSTVIRRTAQKDCRKPVWHPTALSSTATVTWELRYDSERVCTMVKLAGRVKKMAVSVSTNSSNGAVILKVPRAERTPMVAAKPIMAWGSTAPAATAVSDGDGEVPEGIDPDSHVAAAYRGPTAENPSLSLKTRLKRAAFFDQRERQAAAGEAAPLDMTAGLPEAALETV